jgi:hypothetical protein
VSLLTEGHVPGQNCTMTLKRTISERGNLNARKFAIRDLELGPALVKAGKVRGSGGQPLSFSRRIDSLPSSLVATKCPAIMSNGPKTGIQNNSEMLDSQYINCKNKAEDTPRKLTITTQPQFLRTVISLS